MKEWLRQRLIRDANVAHKMWSVRIAVLWAIVSGLWAALPAFQNYVPPFLYALACVGFALLILFARLTHQKGLVDD